MANITMAKILRLLSKSNGKNILIEAYIEMHVDWSGLFNGSYRDDNALYVGPTSIYLFVLLGLLGFELNGPTQTNIMYTYHPKAHQLRKLEDFIVSVLSDPELGKAAVRVELKDKCKIGENALEEHIANNFEPVRMSHG